MDARVNLGVSNYFFLAGWLHYRRRCRRLAFISVLLLLLYFRVHTIAFQCVPVSCDWAAINKQIKLVSVPNTLPPRQKGGKSGLFEEGGLQYLSFILIHR